MSYDYLSPTEFKNLTGLDDAGIADIDPPDSMNIAALITLNSNTKGRFSYQMHSSGLYVKATWVNYYRTDTGNFKVDNDTGSAVLLEREYKDIVIA